MGVEERGRGREREITAIEREGGEKEKKGGGGGGREVERGWRRERDGGGGGGGGGEIYCYGIETLKMIKLHALLYITRRIIELCRQL